jgi:hypothetical protein
MTRAVRRRIDIRRGADGPLHLDRDLPSINRGDAASCTSMPLRRRDAREVGYLTTRVSRRLPRGHDAPRDMLIAQRNRFPTASAWENPPGKFDSVRWQHAAANDRFTAWVRRGRRRWTTAIRAADSGSGTNGWIVSESGSPPPRDGQRKRLATRFIS